MALWQEYWVFGESGRFSAFIACSIPRHFLDGCGQVECCLNKFDFNTPIKEDFCRQRLVRRFFVCPK